MKINAALTTLGMALIVLFLAMAFTAKDVITREIMASLGIIVGALTHHQYSKLNDNEESTDI
jgi:hypothetical protein